MLYDHMVAISESHTRFGHKEKFTCHMRLVTALFFSLFLLIFTSFYFGHGPCGWTSSRRVGCLLLHQLVFILVFRRLLITFSCNCNLFSSTRRVQLSPVERDLSTSPSHGSLSVLLWPYRERVPKCNLFSSLSLSFSLPSLSLVTFVSLIINKFAFLLLLLLLPVPYNLLLFHTSVYTYLFLPVSINNNKQYV